jgi:hypothetical protein
MASNFKLFLDETGDSLHLKLYGDFDGSSAHELIHTLKKCGSRFYQIFTFFWKGCFPEILRIFR